MFYVYILSSRPNGTLYTGMTDDLPRRVMEHKIKLAPGFTAKYGVDRLVWFEVHETREARGVASGISRNGNAPGKFS